MASESFSNSKVQIASFAAGFAHKSPANGGRKIVAFFMSLRNDNNTSGNKISEFSKFYCHGISQKKQRFGAIFPLISSSPTSSKTQLFY